MPLMNEGVVIVVTAYTRDALRPHFISGSSESTGPEHCSFVEVFGHRAAPHSFVYHFT